MKSELYAQPFQSLCRSGRATDLGVWIDVRYWHEADIAQRGAKSAYDPKRTLPTARARLQVCKKGLLD